VKIKKTTLISIACLGIFIGITFFFLFNNDFNTKAYDEEKVIAKQYNSYVKMSKEELFAYADIVALGKVKEISEPGELKHDIGGEEKLVIFNDYTFEIVEAFKGFNPGTEIIIRVPGGKLNNRIFISDAVVPDLNQSQILFLKKYQWGNSNEVTYHILGGHQGKFLVNGNKAIGMEMDRDINNFKDELKTYKDKYGEKIVLPPGFLK